MTLCGRARIMLVMLALAAVLVGLAPASAVAESARIAVVGRLSSGSAADPLHAPLIQAFREGMRALGHVEGRSYRLEARFAEGDPARLSALVSDLVGRGARVIVAAGTDSIRAAAAATRQVPIIMAMSGLEPVRAGLAKSLARPGGNVTGFTGLIDELNPKHLELLREIVPGRRYAGVMYNPAFRAPGRIERIVATGAAIGFRVQALEIIRESDLAPAFETARSAKLAGVVVLGEPALMDRSRARIASLALQHRLPTVAGLRPYAEAGALISYGIDLRDMHRRSAGYVDKILRGAKASDLPIEQPTKFELVINLRTAKALGIAIPQSLLIRADELLE